MEGGTYAFHIPQISGGIYIPAYLPKIDCYCPIACTYGKLNTLNNL